MLISKDGQETESDDDSASDIALVLLVFDVADGSGCQEDNSKDGQDADPDGRAVFTETGEGLEEVDNGRVDDPTVP